MQYHRNMSPGYLDREPPERRDFRGNVAPHVGETFKHRYVSFCANIKEITNEGKLACSCKALFCRNKGTCMYRSNRHNMQLKCTLNKITQFQNDIPAMLRDHCGCVFKFL